jgi:hypothetical protein
MVEIARKSRQHLALKNAPDFGGSFDPLAEKRSISGAFKQPFCLFFSENHAVPG